MEQFLPFGRTDVERSEMRFLADVSTAMGVLSKADVQNPESKIHDFNRQVPALLGWLSSNGRELHWRYTTDPWQVYVSEVLLQRTRASAVQDVYQSFFDKFPDPNTLDDASRESIFETVESLGFGNQRSRSLTEIAEMLVENHDGQVPPSIETLQQPYRAGPYTARACLQFAFNQPTALVDTNIARIFERVFGYEMPAQPHKSLDVYRLVEAVVPDSGAIARAFNFGLLDLAASTCTPTEPSCGRCPLREACEFGSIHD